MNPLLYSNTLAPNNEIVVYTSDTNTSPLLKNQSINTPNNITTLASEALSAQRAIDQKLINKELLIALNHLNNNDANGFDILVKQLKDSGHRHELAALLDKVLVPTILKNEDGARSAYNLIRQTIAKHYPEFKNYFLIKGTDQGAGFSIFTNEALELIFEHLKKKGTFQEVSFATRSGFTYPEDAYQLTNDNSPSQYLVKVIKNMTTDSKSPQKCALAITRVGGRHVIPIFIERTKDGIFRCLVSDSVSRSDWAEHALREVRLAFNLADITASKYEVFNYTGFARQKNGADCALFSIRDLAIMAKNSDYIFEWIKKFGQIEKSEFVDSYFDHNNKTKMPYYKVKFLPPKLMCMAQSLEKLRYFYYLQERQLPDLLELELPTKAISHILPSRKTEKKETLEDNVSKYLFKKITKPETPNDISAKKEFNLKAEHFYLKYEKIILLKLITTR